MYRRRLATTPAAGTALLGVLFGVLLALAAPSRPAAAQATKPKQQKPTAGARTPAAAPSSKAATKSAPKTAANASPLDSAGRQEVLQGKEWQDMMTEFNDWLSDQTMYDSEQVKRIRARLDNGVAKMSPSELRRFMIDMNSKLKVLTSQQAKEAQEFLNETFDVASPAYARRVRQQLPDVLTTSATQIRQQLANFSLKRQSTAQMQQAFEYSRRQQVAFNQAQIKARQDQEKQAVADAAAAAAANEAPLNATPSRAYYPELGAEPVAAPFGAFGVDTYGGAAMW